MRMLATLAFVGLSLCGPPELPHDIGDVPPAEDAPVEIEPPAEAPEQAPEPEAPGEVEPAPAPEDEAIPITPEPEPEPKPEPEPELEPEPEPAPEAPAPPEPAAPAVQKPTPQAPSTQPPGASALVAPAAPPQPTPSTDPGPVAGPQPAEPRAEPEQAEEQREEEQEEQSYRKLGGIRLFRIGLGARIGYTHGTSQKNGLFDRDKSIQDSIDNMMVTTSGAGDLGQTQFGGFQYGFILDAEVVGINVWLDFHKFFRPGGMWSLLLGYDHEFGFGKRLRLDVGVAGGLNQVFLGKVLEDLYYDQDNPEAINIATLGVEGRGMVDLHIKLVGPLFTGPYAMVGYHYLWSANAAEVTAEKGLHYSAGWSLRLDFAAPKLLGGKAKK